MSTPEGLPSKAAIEAAFDRLVDGLSECIKAAYAIDLAPLLERIQVLEDAGRAWVEYHDDKSRRLDAAVVERDLLKEENRLLKFKNENQIILVQHAREERDQSEVENQRLAAELEKTTTERDSLSLLVGEKSHEITRLSEKLEESRKGEK